MIMQELNATRTRHGTHLQQKHHFVIRQLDECDRVRCLTNNKIRLPLHIETKRPRLQPPQFNVGLVGTSRIYEACVR